MEQGMTHQNVSQIQPIVCTADSALVSVATHLYFTEGQNFLKVSIVILTY